MKGPTCPMLLWSPCAPGFLMSAFFNWEKKKFICKYIRQIKFYLRKHQIAINALPALILMRKKYSNKYVYLFNELFICLCVYTNKYIYTISNRGIEKWRISFVARVIKNGRRSSAWTGFYNCKFTSKFKKTFSAKENFLKIFPIALRNQCTFPAEFGHVLVQ